MTEALTGEQRPPGRARRRRARVRRGSAIGLLALLGLGGGMLWLGTPRPLVTVMTPSMEPTLEVGAIALMGSVRGTPEVGDVVEVPVPLDVQREKNYPRSVVHRIVEIDDGMVVTQGDNLGDPDPFAVPIGDIDRRLVRVVPGAGRLVAFMFSPFGLLWVASGLGLFVLHPFVQRERERRLGEHADTKATLDEVVAAVADYGYHLKSHTEILVSMSQAAQDLAAVVARLDEQRRPGVGAAPDRSEPPRTAAPRARPTADQQPDRPVAPSAAAPPAPAEAPSARPARVRPLVAAPTLAPPPGPALVTPRRRQPLQADRAAPAAAPVPRARPVRTRPLTAR